jgi:hypothetical protein
MFVPVMAVEHRHIVSLVAERTRTVSLVVGHIHIPSLAV